MKADFRDSCFKKRISRFFYAKHREEIENLQKGESRSPDSYRDEGKLTEGAAILLYYLRTGLRGVFVVSFYAAPDGALFHNYFFL